MKKLLSFIVFSFSFVAAYACLNEYHVSRSGKATVDHFSMHRVSFFRGFDTVQLWKEIKDMELAEKNGLDKLYTQNNIAVKLIKLGRLNEAGVILQKLYKDHPGEYNVNINLGTLYELMGKNELALSFIRKGIAINPGSHNGSEWIHIRVLENKLKKYDTTYLVNNKLLHLDSSYLSNEELIDNLLDQLKERIPFTPTPNLAMANMLNEFGDLLANEVSISGAFVIYNIALEYYPEDVFSIAPKLEDLKILIRKYKVKYPDYKDYFITVDDNYYRKSRNNKTLNKAFNTLLNEGIKLKAKKN